MKFSIITVCYNSEDTIADAIHSVQKQSYKNFEHIIIDGGSVDQTISIVRATSKDTAIIVSEKDDGIYDAMNKGLGMATGDVVGFLNSDDFYPSSDVLASLANIFEDPTLESCYADLCYVRKDRPESVIRYWRSSSMPREAFLNSWVPPHPTFFVKRKIYEKLGGFNQEYFFAADFDLMLRFLKTHSIKSTYLPKVLVHMRLGGATNNSLRAIFYQNMEIIKALRCAGFRPSIIGFAANKIMTRIRQYLMGAKML